MKNVFLPFSFILISLFASAAGVLAQGTPINTDTPTLLGLEGKAATVRVMVVRKSQLYQDGEKISDSLQREVNGMMFPIAVPYNITSDLLVGGMIPLINVQAKSLSGSRSSFGLGDLSLFTKYLVVQIDGLQETFRIIGKGSIKLPNSKGGETTMKRKLALILAIAGVTLSALAFAGTNPQPSENGCPLRGTPACPEYPSCCK